MLENHTLLKHDPTRMHKIYDAWPHIAKDSYETDYETADFEIISHIVFTGWEDLMPYEDLIVQ